MEPTERNIEEQEGAGDGNDRAFEVAQLEEKIIEGLKMIYDPEIPVNIYDLGLIYDIRIAPDNSVHIVMTLTAPGCPVAGILPQQVENRVRLTPGVTDARVELTFDPPYQKEMMSEEARLELGLWW